MEITELKRYIFENNKIEFVLKSINCHDIKYHPVSDMYSCANYDGDNKTAINVKNNEYLNVTNWTREKYFDEKSDIITLVQYNLQCSFIDALKYIYKILDLKFDNSKKSKSKTEKVDPLYVFKKVQSKQRIDVNDIHTIEEEILDSYVPLVHIDFYREGIMPWTAKKFGLAYSYKQKRVIIPIRHWMTKELVGINARTTIKNFEEFGIKKYFITPSYKKSSNLYGLAENYEQIKKAGYVVVYEAEKSVLKRDSLTDSTGVALMGHTLSDEQARILIGLDVDIIIALDKDISLNEIRFMCEKFGNTRRVFYIYDKWGLLEDKESPADKPNKIFNFLMKYKIRYDTDEHREYLKSLNNKSN